MRTKKAMCVIFVLFLVMAVMGMPFVHQTETMAEEGYEWIQTHSSAKYRITEVNHVIYYYFTEDYTGDGWLEKTLGLSLQASASEDSMLPCENRDFLRIAGAKEESETYHAGELVAMALNLETVQDQEEIRIADSLIYEGESIPVTRVELNRFVYAFSTDEYKYSSFNILSDSVKLYIGNNVTDIHFGDTVSVISEYNVNENNNSFCSADGVLYSLDEEGNSSLLHIPDLTLRLL